ncbi:PDZ domain-containing protein GIPC1-like [Hyalella azteca]|uniref:PDZ domain-containing protein GIPC1-like n=1 Tax=Hyalella azteca TaxID=294128 RepID=A0A979FLG2_HYAAZ|nr:PDZ domain-containing protein GIPC1-like [Hyalella azteca]
MPLFKPRRPLPETSPLPPPDQTDQQQTQQQKQQTQQQKQQTQQQKSQPKQQQNGRSNGQQNTKKTAALPPPQAGEVTKPKLVFHCQQAHGSPTGIISGFTNVKELYQKIADCYGIPAADILFCTLNTHKVDMTHLLGGQIGLDDFIFAHRKGVAKEVEIVKTEDALGLTITDNGAGYAFIKRIKEGSVIDKLKLVVEVGDHIERIDGTSLVGRRHFEVAKLLKEIPRGASFVMRLVQPLKAGFANIGPRSDPRSGSKKGLGSGKQTLRFKANGQAQVEDVDDHATVAIEKINSLLENFLGINDNDLAAQIWDLGQGKQNTMEFAEAVDDSDLESFGFNDDFIFELWGAITDAKSGRLKRV